MNLNPIKRLVFKLSILLRRFLKQFGGYLGVSVPTVTLKNRAIQATDDQAKQYE